MSYGILGLLFRKFITVMSYGRHGVSNNRHLDCLFVPTAKKNMKALHYFPFWRVATGDQMKSSHKGQWCRKVFMSWPKHANPDDKKELILCQVIALDQWWHIIYWLYFIDILQKHLFFQQNAFDNVICRGAPHICFGPMRRSSCYHCVQVCTPPCPLLVCHASHPLTFATDAIYQGPILKPIHIFFFFWWFGTVRFYPYL